MARRVLTARELGRATLARQLLLAREDVPVVEAVERVGGLQAQEPRPPFVGLWSRLAGFAAGDLLGPLRAGELVRGMLMRATLHLVSAADFAALRPALAPVMTAAMNGALRGRMDGLDLDEVLPAARPPGDTPAPPRLLPEFDSLVLAHADRSRVIADEHRPLVVTKNLRVRATFLLDGAVAGTWSIERKGRTATLRLAPFGRLRKADERALTAEAEALLAFAEPDAGTHAVSRDD